MPRPSDDPQLQLLAEASFVQRLARSLVNDAALADDVAQETMAAALRQPVAPRSWRDWLAAVARRLAGKARTARRVRAAHEAAAARAGAGGAAGGTAERLRLQQLLTQAVTSLAEPYRTVVTLRFFDNLTPRAIAKRTGATSEAVRQQLHRGLAMLRQRLDRECGDRQRWLGAFAGAGLGGFTVSLAPVAVLAMNKLMLAAAAAVLVAGGAVWMVGDPFGVAAPAQSSSRAAIDPIASDSAHAAPQEPAALQRRDAAPASARCVVVVRDARGRPIDNATVTFWGAQGDLLECGTDADGAASAPAAGPGGVLVCAAEHVPAWLPMQERHGHYELQLDDGATLSGTLLVDGLPAHAGTELRVSGSGKHAFDVTLPDVLATLTTWQAPPRLLVAQNGTFSLSGLPDDLQADVRLPRELWLLPESGGSETNHSSFAIRPGQSPVVYTTRLPVLEGRVVWDDNQEGVPAADVLAYGEFDDGSSATMFSLGTRPDGSFRAAIVPMSSAAYRRWNGVAHRPQVAVATLHVKAPGAEPLDWTCDVWPAPNPLIVRLQRAITGHLLVVDQAGQAIAGARVLARGTSEATDMHGRGTFAGSAETIRLIGAPGFRVGPATPLRGSGFHQEDPLVFELQRDNAVRVQILGTAASFDAPVKLELRAHLLPYAGRRAVNEFDAEIHGECATDCVYWTENYCGSIATLRTDAELIVHSLEPGTQLTLALVDPLHLDIVAARVVAPPFGEAAEVTLRMPDDTFAVRGQVIDETGVPLPGIVVTLMAIDEHGETMQTPGGVHATTSATSENDGQFAIRGLTRRTPCRLLVKKAGFVERVLDIPAAQLESPQVLQMVRGRSVMVRVVDSDGIPVAANARLRGGTCTRCDLDAGVSRFDDLTPGAATFVATIGNAPFVLEHDTTRPEATIRVPKPAQLRIAAANGWPSVSGDVSTLFAHAISVDRSEEPVLLRPSENGSEGTHLLLPGRYRIELFERRGTEQLPLHLTAEVTLRAGELTTATLR